MKPRNRKRRLERIEADYMEVRSILDALWRRYTAEKDAVAQQSVGKTMFALLRLRNLAREAP